jgi:hypothetical protein
MLPDRNIHAILQKFGPEISEYLKAIGYFDLEGPYQPTDILNQAAMRRYLKASTAKNRLVWAELEKWLFPEMVDFGAAFIAVYGLKPTINLREIATGYMEKRGGELIKRMTATDQKRLTNYIWQNSEKNERPLARQILKEPNLSSIVDNSGARTRTIIRTERGRAIRNGSLDFAKSAGAETKTWWTVGDARVRKEHQALHGKTIVIGGEYEITIGKKKPKTYTEEFPAQKDVNCRCWLEFGFTKMIANHPHPSMSKLQELYA